MNEQTISKGILKALGIVVGIVLLLWFLYKIQSVILYICIAGVISLIGRPLVLFLKKKLKFKTTLAVITAMLIFLSILIGLVLLFIPLIAEQSHNLSLLDINTLQTNVEELYTQTVNYFSTKHINLPTLEESKLLNSVNFGAIPDFLNNMLSGFGSFSIGLFSVLFISFFFLKDSKLLEEGISIFIPQNKETVWKKSSNQIKDLLSRYFIGLILQISILFVIYTIGLLILGVNNAIVIAFLCALLNLIPYVGPLIGGFLMITLTMTSNLGESFSSVILPKTIWVLIIFLLGQLVDNFFSQPFIFSKSVKSHPLEIFLVILCAGLLFGVVGLIVAVPAYTSIKVILKGFLSENRIVKKLTKDL